MDLTLSIWYPPKFLVPQFNSCLGNWLTAEGARFPEATFPGLKSLLGRTGESDVVQRFLEQHPTNKLVQSNRSIIAFQNRESIYTVEELVAMQLVNIKSQAEKMAEEKIKELVLTVPAFWTEQERNAIVDAADVAGMRVSTLIHDGFAGDVSE